MYPYPTPHFQATWQMIEMYVLVSSLLQSSKSGSTEFIVALRRWLPHIFYFLITYELLNSSEQPAITPVMMALRGF